MHADGRGLGIPSIGRAGGRAVPILRGLGSALVFDAATATRAADDARAQLRAIDARNAAQFGPDAPRLADSVPPIDLAELNQYASAAQQFLDDPVAATVPIAVDYLRKTVADEVTEVVSQYLTTALTTAGAAIGTAIPVPLVGTLVGAAAGKLLGVAVDGVTEALRVRENVDAYADKNGALIPEVETVLARWSPPDRPISPEVHAVDRHLGKGAFVIWGGYRWNIPVPYWWGPLGWTTDAQRAAFGASHLWPIPDALARHPQLDTQYAERLARARVMSDALERELSVALSVFATRRSNESQAKAMMVHRMIASEANRQTGSRVRVTAVGAAPKLNIKLTDAGLAAALTPKPATSPAVVAVGGVGAAAVIWWLVRRVF